MSEFLHDVVKKRERDEEYRTLMINPPRMVLPTSLMNAIQRDMERQYTMLAESAIRLQRG